MSIDNNNTKSSETPWMIYGLVGLIIAILGGLTWYYGKNSSGVANSGYPVREKVKSTVADTSIVSRTDTVKGEVLKIFEKKNEVARPAAQPQALVPNPNFESKIGNPSAQGGHIILSKPNPGQGVLLDPSGKIKIGFSGIFTPNGNGANLKCCFYNNTSDKPVSCTDIPLRPEGEKFFFEFAQSLKANLGLHYYTIESGGNNLATGKFVVQ